MVKTRLKVPPTLLLRIKIVIYYMCEQVAVMQHGKLLELLTINSDGKINAQHPYTIGLNQAAKGYDREVVNQFIDYD